MSISFVAEVEQFVPLLHASGVDREGRATDVEEFYQVHLAPVELNKEEYLKLLGMSKEHTIKITIGGNE